MKTILVDAVGTFVSEEGVVFAEMQKLLDEYPNRKILVTGADYETTNKYNLNHMPYEVFTLKHDPEKTEPKYFQMLMEEFGLKSNELIYFEHNPEAVKSAESVGIVSYYYDEVKKDLSALKKFLDANV